MTLSAAASASDQLGPEHDVEFLPRSNTLTFDRMLAAAEKLAPDTWEHPARERQAHDYQQRGKRWFADNPSIVVNYYDDSAFGHQQTRELEAGIEFELWSWRARKQWQRLGQRAAAQIAQWQLHLRWQLAGQLRDILADLALSDLNLSLAQQQLASTQSLFDISQRLFQQGAIARENLLRVEAVLLTSQQKLLDAESAAVDAQRRFVTLSGMATRPAETHREALSELDDIVAGHPALALVQWSIELAETQAAIEQRQGKANPTLLLGVRNEKTDIPGETIDSIALSVTLPIGTSHSATTRVAAIHRERAALEVAYERKRRTLEQQRHEYHHELGVLERKLPLAQKAASLAEQRWQMAQTAFRVGELRQDDVVRALQRWHDDQTRYQQMRLAKERLICQYNQTVGVLP